MRLLFDSLITGPAKLKTKRHRSRDDIVCGAGHYEGGIDTVIVLNDEPGPGNGRGSRRGALLSLFPTESAVKTGAFFAIIQIRTSLTVEVPKVDCISLSMPQVSAFQGYLSETTGNVECVLGDGVVRNSPPEGSHDFEPGIYAYLEVSCTDYVVELKKVVGLYSPFKETFEEPCEDMVAIVDAPQEDRLTDQTHAPCPQFRHYFIEFTGYLPGVIYVKDEPQRSVLAQVLEMSDGPFRERLQAFGSLGESPECVSSGAADEE